MRGANRYALWRGKPIDVPTVLLILSWPALWMVWPPLGAAPPVKGARIDPLRVTYVGANPSTVLLYRQPLAFIGSSLSDPVFPEESFREMLKPRRMPRSRLLPMLPDAGRQYERVRPDLSLRAASGLTGFDPRWKDDPVFGRNGGQDSVLLARADASLQAAGFRLPALEDLKDKFPGPWEVTVFVECGEEGRVEHVFLEKGAEKADIGGALVRRLYGGVAGGRAAGRVTVSVGRQ